MNPGIFYLVYSRGISRKLICLFCFVAIFLFGSLFFQEFSLLCLVCGRFFFPPPYTPSLALDLNLKRFGMVAKQAFNNSAPCSRWRMVVFYDRDMGTWGTGKGERDRGSKVSLGGC